MRNIHAQVQIELDLYFLYSYYSNISVFYSCSDLSFYFGPSSENTGESKYMHKGKHVVNCPLLTICGIHNKIVTKENAHYTGKKSSLIESSRWTHIADPFLPFALWRPFFTNAAGPLSRLINSRQVDLKLLMHWNALSSGNKLYCLLLHLQVNAA